MTSVYYSGSRFNMDCDWSSHLLHSAAVRGRWSLCDLQEEVRSLPGMLHKWSRLHQTHQRENGTCFVWKPRDWLCKKSGHTGVSSHHITVFSVSVLCLCYRQTEGPTGPLIASSNPEYLSANDGKKSIITKQLGGAICERFTLSKMVFVLCSVCSWWVGGAPGEDHGAQRAGSGLLRHGVRGNRQGHRQRRPRHTSSCQDGQWIGQPAREDRVPQRSLRHEGFQLSPRGTTRQDPFQTAFSYNFITATIHTSVIYSILQLSVIYIKPSYDSLVDALILAHSLTKITLRKQFLLNILLSLNKMAICCAIRCKNHVDM